MVSESQLILFPPIDHVFLFSDFYLQNFFNFIRNLRALSFLGRAPPSAPMDVVSCHVSYDVNGHQYSQSSCYLHCYSNAASTHSVVDPVNVTERKAVRSNSIWMTIALLTLFYSLTWFHHIVTLF